MTTRMLAFFRDERNSFDPKPREFGENPNGFQLNKMAFGLK